MNKKYNVIWMAIIAAHLFVTNAAAQSDNVLSFNGIGVLKIGMDISEAQKLSGKKISESIIYDVPPEYKSATVEGESYYLSLAKGKISCIHIREGNYSTKEGIKVGDDIQKVKEVYKAYPISSETFQYQQGIFSPKEQAEQLTVSGKDKAELVFQIYHHKVGDILLTRSDIQALSCKL